MYIILVFLLVVYYSTSTLTFPTLLENLSPSALGNGISPLALDFSRPLNASVNAEVINHRVANTPIALKISLNPNTIIDGPDMARTLLQTQVTLRRYISRHYRSDEDVLFPSDDPYMSSVENTGCFFGATHYPMDQPKRLTYGMVDSILTGVFDVLYREERHIGADILIVHDFMGMVGFGRVTKNRPGRWVQRVAVG